MNKVSNKTKKTIDIVVNVILWIFVAFAVAVTVFAFATSSNAKNVPVIGGKCYLSVMSDSMKSDKAESFKKGDLIIGEYIYDKADAIDSLKVGDIITFEIDLNGDGEISKANTILTALPLSTEMTTVCRWLFIQRVTIPNSPIRIRAFWATE